MYVPLRVHGHHSLLTGIDPPKSLLERTQGLGLPALALADVDSLAGMVEFLEAAKGGAVRPIVAAELSDTGDRPGRLVALVRDEQGYRSLCRLVSARQLGRDPGTPPEPGEDEEDDPEFDLIQAAAKHQEGLCFLADHPRLLLGLHGRVPTDRLLAAISPACLQLGRRRETPVHGARRNTHLSPAGPQDLTAELRAEVESDIEAPKTPPPARAVPALSLVDAARAVGVATLAVPDVYHVLPGGAADHRVCTAIKHNALLEGLPEEWVAEEPAHLPTFAEMCALYADLPDVPGPWRGEPDARVPGAVARTLEVAASCRYTPPLGEVFFPEVELDEGETPYSKLCELAFEGVRRRYRPLRPEVLRRLDYELTTIHQLGFAAYFLLVERIAAYAEREGIPCVGRGSAADSLVAYGLGLTDADPLRYGLPFERFLNPARRDRPDVDLDFCWRRRDQVLEHVFELFGPERTAMICTLNRFGMRSAFREAALVHGIPPAEIQPWSSRLPMFPPHPEDVVGSEEPAANPLVLALRSIPEARAFPFEDERFERALVAAQQLLDAPRHFGLHPGGVVVSPGPITDLVTCQAANKLHPTRGRIVVTQFDKDAVEAIGLVKMDLLGNRALTVIDDCLRTLGEEEIEVDLETIPEDDPHTASLLKEGRTLGCFQIESPGMRNLLQQTGATAMDDVIQAVALIRPGPAGSGMKDAYVRRFRGLEDPTPPHPRLVDVLWDTHGVMLYQEDVMQAASRVAGMDLAEADQLRRALQKRHTADLEPLRVRFLASCEQDGVSEPEAEAVWNIISNFASFAFCKAHAVTYGRIAYRTAYLKTHHPAAFLVSFLGSDTGYYPQRVYVEEARRLGVPILPPDVNRSGETFAVERVPAPDGSYALAMRIGLGQTKGLSARTFEALLTAREMRGSFLSLPDFLDRTGAHTNEAEGLIQCGALDSFDRTRPELLWRLHLLRAPRKRMPRGERMDPRQLDACRNTPGRQVAETLRAAQARSVGWSGRGIGVTGAEPAPDAPATLFPEPEPGTLVLPGLPDTDPLTRGRLEFEILGFSVHAHPVALFPCPADERIVARFGHGPAATHGKFHSTVHETTADPRPVNPVPCGRFARFRGGRVTLRGWPAATRRVRTEQGRLMRFLTLEDESGLAEVVLFPDVYERDGERLNEEGVLCVTGIVEDQMGACTLHAERIW